MYLWVSFLHGLWDSSRELAVVLTYLLTGAPWQIHLLTIGFVPAPTPTQVELFTWLSIGGLTVVATQTFRHPRSSTAERLRAQAEGRHYSTFSLYTPDELRASIATFLARLPSPEVSWVDEHLLVIAAATTTQTPAPRPAPRTRRSTTSPPHQRPGTPARLPKGIQVPRPDNPLCAQPITGDNLR